MKRWKHRPEGSTWGDWGDDDELGRVNLITPEKVLRHAQRKMDVLDLEANRLSSASVDDVIRDSAHLPVDLFVAPNQAASSVLTFEKLLGRTPFVDHVRAMLKSIRRGGAPMMMFEGFTSRWTRPSPAR